MDPNSSDSIGVFTNVSQHIEWICDIYANYVNKTSNKLIVTFDLLLF